MSLNRFNGIHSRLSALTQMCASLVSMDMSQAERIDLTTSNFPQRLTRDQAKFQIEGDRDFAQVRIQK